MNSVEPKPSPFHAGEQAIQSRLGVRDQMESFGRRVIRDHMPDQHQAFYRQLPYVLVGSMDDAGRPWASILCGPPGFLQVPDPHSLRCTLQPLSGDPLGEYLSAGQPVGVLGIELATRRRNRLSARVSGVTKDGFDLDVVQSFGNCPQYIQARALDYLEAVEPTAAERFSALSDEHRGLINRADTFFVASASAADPGERAADGVDVSHRGGRPGFVRVESDGTLVIPDFAGNNHFNTLGNFLAYPRAGLLFVDFESGDLLSLTGRAEIVWDAAETALFEGAERLWTFRTEAGVLLRAALPMRARSLDPSPDNAFTGDWQQVARRRGSEQWQRAEVLRVVDESRDIRSFHLAPAGGTSDYRPGQFLTLRARVGGQSLQRTYTVSGTPHKPYYRISVKRDGVFSRHLHEAIGPGDTLEIRHPMGGFCYESDREEAHVLLLAAGVGITPMLPMARAALASGRRVTLLAIARNAASRAFNDELAQLQREASGNLQLLWCLTRPEPDLRMGVDYDWRGRPDTDSLAALLPGDDPVAYLCGPPHFMQDSYRLLRQLGLPDDSILAESFGPAGLQRDDAAVEMEGVAEQAVVSFVDAAGQLLAKQAWQREDGDLLGFAEAHGLTPAFACRRGQCGSCRAVVTEGEVVQPDALAGVTSRIGEALLCCARPAATAEDSVSRLRVVLPDQP